MMNVFENVIPQEERRRQLAEAAEKRLKEQESRGVKNVDAVRRQQERKAEMERREEALAHQGLDDKPVLKVKIIMSYKRII
jgi:hypothetical protein